MVAPALSPGSASARPDRPRHRHLRALLVLVAAVALAHAWVVDELGARLGRAAGDQAPDRIQAIYARQIVPEAPPAVASPAPPPAPAAPTVPAVTMAALLRAEAAEPVASAPEAVPEPATEPVPESVPESVPEPARESDPVVRPAAASTAEAASAAALATQASPPDAPGSAAAAQAGAQAGPPEGTQTGAVLEPPAPAPARSVSQGTPPGHVPEPDRPGVIAAAPTASAAASTAQAGLPAAAARTTGFVWPPSTRMSYTLTGYYRGDVQGTAQVEWIKAGERYQVHLDVLIGPSFAPLMSRRMSSDGVITDNGLVPQRYDEVTRTGFRTRQATVRLEPGTVTLANGTRVPSQPGVQDTASQFVQLTQRFMREPHLLRPGQSLAFPLALPRHLNLWVYDVLDEESLATPFGEVPVLHLKPRRPDKPRKDLEVEIWYAPTLQYLPVRIRIRQDESTYVDLMIEKLPEQAQPEGG